MINLESFQHSQNEYTKRQKIHDGPQAIPMMFLPCRDDMRVGSAKATCGASPS